MIESSGKENGRCSEQMEYTEKNGNWGEHARTSDTTKNLRRLRHIQKNTVNGKNQVQVINTYDPPVIKQSAGVWLLANTSNQTLSTGRNARHWWQDEKIQDVEVQHHEMQQEGD